MKKNRYKISERLLNTMYPLVGAIVLSWSLAESALEHMVVIFFKEYGGNTIEKKIPFMLGEKIKFCKKCLERFDALKKFKRRGLLLLERTENLSMIRHDLIHGSLSEYHPKRRKIMLSRLKGDKLHNPMYSIRQLLTAQKRILNLASEIPAFNELVFNNRLLKRGGVKR